MIYLVTDLYQLLISALDYGDLGAYAFYDVLLNILVAIICLGFISLPFIIIYKVVEIISEGVN